MCNERIVYVIVKICLTIFYRYHDELENNRNNSKTLLAMINYFCNKIVYGVMLITKFKVLTKNKN